MNGKKVWLLLLALGTWLVALPTDFVVGSSKTIRGWQEIGVFVETLDPEIEHSGVSRQQLRSEMEAKLRQAGIKVAATPNTGALPRPPYIYLNLSMKKIVTMFAYNADILYITPNMAGSGAPDRAAWSYTTSGILKEPQAVRGKVLELLGRFLKDNAS